MTLLSQAIRLSEHKHLRYVPGLPIVTSNTPITRPPKAAFTPLTSPSIYTPPYSYASHHTITNTSIDSRVVSSVLRGEGSTDFPGLVMLSYFRTDPEAWDTLFVLTGNRLSYSRVLAKILGIPLADALLICNDTDKTPLEHYHALETL